MIDIETKKNDKKKYEIVIINNVKKAKEYHQKNKEKLQEKPQNEYNKLFNKENDIRKEYGRNRYRNMSEEDKQRLKGYKKNYRDLIKVALWWNTV